MTTHLFGTLNSTGLQASKGGGALDTPYTPSFNMVDFIQPRFGDWRLGKASKKRISNWSLLIYSYIMYHYAAGKARYLDSLAWFNDTTFYTRLAL